MEFPSFFVPCAMFLLGGHCHEGVECQKAYICFFVCRNFNCHRSACYNERGCRHFAQFRSAIVFGVCSLVYAVIAFWNKEQGNLFLLGRNKLVIAFLRSFSDDKPDTDSDEYKKEFELSAFIFCASIPFYIPLAFFANGLYTALTSALSVTILRILFTLILVLVPRIMKHAQDRRQGRIKDEADKKEQERRESMGKWK